MAVLSSFVVMESILPENTVRTLISKGYWPAEALECLNNCQYGRVVELCRRGLKSEPSSVAGRLILARALYHSDQPEKAREEFLNVLRADPGHLVALKYLGDISFEAGQEAAAMTYYRTVQEIDPYCGGLQCAVRKKVPEPVRQVTIKRRGEVVVKATKKKVPEPAFVTETVGDIYFEQGHYDLAGEVFRRLQGSRPSSRLADKLREVEEKLSRKE